MKFFHSVPAIEFLEARITPSAFSVFGIAELNGKNGFSAFNDSYLPSSWSTAANVGDLNGDGFDDIAVGFATTPYGAANAICVLFGSADSSSTPKSISELDGTNGFAILGTDETQSIGAAVSGAGDVNNDGFDDLVFGAAGSAYVLFGHAGAFPATITPSALTGGVGFKISGEPGTGFGSGVAAAGDINGDDFDDLVISASLGNSGGKCYILFGGATLGSSLDTSTLDGTNGFSVSFTRGRFPHSVAGGGDMNGDGFADIVIGESSGLNYGAAHVIFGKSGTFAATFDVADLNGVNGFTFVSDEQDGTGRNIATGDINGDGFTDLIVGFQNNLDGCNIVYGRASGFGATISPGDLDGSIGFVLKSDLASNYAHSVLASPGDVNGDGRDDLVWWANGAAHLIYGKLGAFAAEAILSELGSRDAVRLVGDSFSIAGQQLGVGGDINGDGLADIVLGGPHVSANGAQTSVIFGTENLLGHPEIQFSSSGKTARFHDADGDLVTVKISKGALRLSDFAFSDLVWQKLDLRNNSHLFANTSIDIAVKKSATGDGLVNIGQIDAAGINLGTVTVRGDIGQIDAGTRDPKIPAIRKLNVGSIGLHPDTQPPGKDGALISNFEGNVPEIIVKGDVRGVLSFPQFFGASTIAIGGNLDGRAGGEYAGFVSAWNIKSISVKGSVFGGAEFSGIEAVSGIAKIVIGGDVTSAVSGRAVTISSRGGVSPKLAIGSITIGGNVHNAVITGDSGIGPVVVKGNWSSSSIAAGPDDITDDGYGQNDFYQLVEPHKSAAPLVSMTIGGTATGSPTGGDFFGITAGKIGRLKIGKTSVVLPGGPNNILLDVNNGDFRIVDFA